MSTRQPSEAILEVRNIWRTFRNSDVEIHAVRDVSLTVPRGQFVAVMGSSGSGKSTLMNILGCLDRPTAGDFSLAGRDVGGLSRGALAVIRNELLGFVFQSFNLLARTSALENTELPLLYSVPIPSAAERRARARAALDRVGLGHRLDHQPSELSGGQQQRNAIARALVTRPALLLADEPTGNLDTRTGLDIMQLFQELNQQGLTILMVTHEPDIAAYCHRTIRMRDGQIIADAANPHPRDAHADLLAYDADPSLAVRE
ncbi:MAG: ABC transporter ATP-binding protein [Gemmatimonadetes bacterium]|nr:ABC transporter ATP-binding protein [Gemmatimonadota bacterium]